MSNLLAANEFDISGMDIQIVVFALSPVSKTACAKRSGLRSENLLTVSINRQELTDFRISERILGSGEVTYATANQFAIPTEFAEVFCKDDVINCGGSVGNLNNVECCRSDREDIAVCTLVIVGYFHIISCAGSQTADAESG